MSDPDWRADVLRFWLGQGPDKWWAQDDALDTEIRERFHELWEEQRQFPASSFLADPLSALAAVILFDQFPRNMFRGHADQFSTDHLALEIAKAAIDRGYDEELEAPFERAFLYLPFEHSERPDDQRQSLLLFTALGDEKLLDYARKHHDVIAKFGRFPHRNPMLGRKPRPDEIAAGDVVPW